MKPLHLAICLLLTILLFPGGTGHADSPAPPAKSFLWQVHGPNGTVHLFGSVHLARPDIYPLPPQVEESFSNADVLALEADPGAAVTEQMQRRLVMSALYPRGDSLKQHLSPKAYEAADQATQRLGLSLEQLSRSKPWFVAMSIAVMELQQLGYRPEQGIDRHFAERARGEKEIVELESFMGQINTLNNLSDREQELFLLYTVAEMATLREDAEEMMRAWRAGDVKSMEQMIAQSITTYPETKSLHEKLFHRRNRSMASAVEQLLQQGKNAFVVVGTAHLLGPEGIIALLQRKGYRVEQQ